MKIGDGQIWSTVCHVSLQAGPNVCLTYRMAYFRVCQNCNGTLPDRRIVMVYFRSSIIVMAPIQKKPYNKWEDQIRSHTLRGRFYEGLVSLNGTQLEEIKKSRYLSYPSSLPCRCCSRRREEIIVVGIVVHRCRRRRPRSRPRPWPEPLSLSQSPWPPWPHRCASRPLDLGVGPWPAPELKDLEAAAGSEMRTTGRRRQLWDTSVKLR